MNAERLLLLGEQICLGSNGSKDAFLVTQRENESGRKNLSWGDSFSRLLFIVSQNIRIFSLHGKLLLVDFIFFFFLIIHSFKDQNL